MFNNDESNPEEKLPIYIFNENGMPLYVISEHPESKGAILGLKSLFCIDCQKEIIAYINLSKIRTDMTIADVPCPYCEEISLIVTP